MLEIFDVAHSLITTGKGMTIVTNALETKNAIQYTEKYELLNHCKWSYLILSRINWKMQNTLK